MIARESSVDWRRVDDLLELTLRSVMAQTDGDFGVLLAGHDEPQSWRGLTKGDPRFRFLRAEWPPGVPSPRNDDGGCKKWLLKEHVRESGGGLLMYLDADDLVDTRLVEMAREMIQPRHVGAMIDHGIAVDFRTLRAVRLPNPRVFDGEFHEICGSSTIGRVERESPDPFRHDPHDALGSHHQWPRAAAEAGVSLARLPAWGAYLVNTSENHSELHGPFASWRQALNDAVAVEGTPIDDDLASRFGLDLGILTSKSDTSAASASARRAPARPGGTRPPIP